MFSKGQTALGTLYQFNQHHRVAFHVVGPAVHGLLGRTEGDCARVARLLAVQIAVGHIAGIGHG